MTYDFTDIGFNDFFSQFLDRILNAAFFSTTEAVLKGEKLPDGVKIEADKRLILEFVKVRRYLPTSSPKT